MTFASILPLAFVMIAGPQIISAIFLATSATWAKSTLGYLLGAAASITGVVTLAYFLGKSLKSAAGDGTDDKAGHIIDWAVLALVLYLIVHVFLTRKTREPPKWMGKLQKAKPSFAFLLGFALLGVFPTDLISSVTVGLHLAREGEPWWECLPFVALTLILLGLPALGVVLLGERASTVLPKIRDWMNAKSWVVSEVVLVFFAAITVNSLLSG
jgi:hypothetical protein